MKCPHCEETVIQPIGRRADIRGSDGRPIGLQVLLLYCPFCLKILGAVRE